MEFMYVWMVDGVNDVAIGSRGFSVPGAHQFRGPSSSHLRNFLTIDILSFSRLLLFNARNLMSKI